MKCWLCKKNKQGTFYNIQRIAYEKGLLIIDKMRSICSDCFDSHCIFSLDKHPKED